MDEDEHANGENKDSDCRGDPVDIGTTCPAKNEEADWRENGGVEGRDQKAFWFGESSGLNFDFKDKFEVTEVDGDRDPNSDGNDEEDETELTKGHMVVVYIDDWENFKEAIIYAIDNGDVDGCEEDSWIEEVDLPWSD